MQYKPPLGIPPELRKTLFLPKYFAVTVKPNLLLTNTLTTVTGFTNFVVPVGITESSGVFTFDTDGIYQFSLERGYINEDQNPSSPIELTIEVWINGVFGFDRTGIIGSATSPNEPTLLSVTSPSLLQVNAGDTIEVKVKATEGVGSPSSTYLTVMQIMANKVHNTPS